MTTVSAPEKFAPAASTSDSQRQRPSRHSARVRVLRRPHNIGDVDISSIPSSQNRRRLRSAMVARTQAYEKVLALCSGFKAQVSNKKSVEAIKISSDTFVDSLPLPKNYDDAVLGPYRDYWIPAIAEELENLRNYKVWRQEIMPKNAIPIRGKFVFKWKPNSKNRLEKAKARFTMQGCRQLKGIHYRKTYAPVAFASSLRLVLKLGVDLDYCLDVTDLKAAYLTAHLEPNIV